MVFQEKSQGNNQAVQAQVLQHKVSVIADQRHQVKTHRKRESLDASSTGVVEPRTEKFSEQSSHFKSMTVDDPLVDRILS